MGTSILKITIYYFSIIEDKMIDDVIKIINSKLLGVDYDIIEKNDYVSVNPIIKNARSNLKEDDLTIPSYYNFDPPHKIAPNQYDKKEKVDVIDVEAVVVKTPDTRLIEAPN
jgi:hypothetical protein